MTPDQITQLRQHLKNIERYYTKRDGQLNSPMYVRQELKQALALLPCPECEKILRAKCNWEQMSRKAVLEEWPNLKCPDCQKHCVCCEEVTKENAHLHRNCGK